MTRTGPAPAVALLAVVLATAWLLWSGLYKPLLLILGLLSVVVVLVVAARMDLLRRERFVLHVGPRLPGFWLWLMREVAVSSFRVARIVLHPRLPVSPTLVRIRALAKGPVGQATLGNALTLTPGTVTIDVHEGELLVHCLTAKDADALRSDDLNRRVAALTDR